MASYLLLFTGVLSALSYSSHSLSCIQCYNEAELCTAPVQACPKPDQICTLITVLTSVEGKPQSKWFYRECGDRAVCHQSGSLTMPGKRLQTSTTCCDSDGCTPEMPVLPPISNEKNGVSCQSCKSYRELWCESSDYIQCVGEEVKCFKQSEISEDSTGTKRSSMRGCITKGLCNVTHMEGSLQDSTSAIDVTCSDGCTALYYSLSPLLLTIGLIVKVFY